MKLSQSNLEKLMYVILLLVFIASFISVAINYENVHTTNKVVTSQIPGLQSQIQQRDKTISDQHYELNEAIAAIKALAAKLQTHGINPGEITINPPPNK